MKNLYLAGKKFDFCKDFYCSTFCSVFSLFYSDESGCFFANKKFNKDDLVYVFMLTKPNI